MKLLQLIHKIGINLDSLRFQIKHFQKINMKIIVL